MNSNKIKIERYIDMPIFALILFKSLVVNVLLEKNNILTSNISNVYEIIKYRSTKRQYKNEI